MLYILNIPGGSKCKIYNMTTTTWQRPHLKETTQEAFSGHLRSYKNVLGLFYGLWFIWDFIKIKLIFYVRSRLKLNMLSTWFLI